MKKQDNKDKTPVKNFECKPVTTPPGDGEPSVWDTMDLKEVNIFLPDFKHTAIVFKEKNWDEHTMTLNFVILPHDSPDNLIHELVKNLENDSNNVRASLNNVNDNPKKNNYVKHCYTFALKTLAERKKDKEDTELRLKRKTDKLWKSY